MADDGFMSPAASQGGQDELSEEEQRLQAWAAHQLAAGSELPDIQQELEEQGLSRSRAAYLVDRTRASLQQAAEAEQITGRALILGAVGGLAAAALGAAIWAWLTVATDSEFGALAWGIGGLCGFAVMLLAKPARGRALQVVAVLASVLGIVGGKYATFYMLAKEYAAQEAGAEAAAEIQLLSPELISMFFGSIAEWFSAFDLLWVGLAVFTAWGIPKSGGLGKLLRPGGGAPAAPGS